MMAMLVVDFFKVVDIRNGEHIPGWIKPRCEVAHRVVQRFSAEHAGQLVDLEPVLEHLALHFFLNACFVLLFFVIDDDRADHAAAD